MEFLSFFTNEIASEVWLKLLLAVLLSLTIGIERELIHKPAGIKTHMLVCVSSTLVMMLGIDLYKSYPHLVDPSRLPAQILTGIGFVGAGTIIRDGFSVKGITTAASLLAITCIGLAVGAGYFEGAVIATIIVFLTLALTTPLQNLIHVNKKITLFTITAHARENAIGEIDNFLTSKNIEILNIKQIHDEISEYTLLKFLVKLRETNQKESLIHEICSLKCVKEVYVSKKTYQHDQETE